jgi:hypothetical protein
LSAAIAKKAIFELLLQRRAAMFLVPVEVRKECEKTANRKKTMSLGSG